MMPIKSIFFLFVIIICLVLLFSYTFTGGFEFWNIVEMALTKTGTLNIAGAVPMVVNIYLNETPTFLDTCDPYLSSACTIPMNENKNTTEIINATIYDLNGDCDSVSPVFTVWAYICNNSFDYNGVCNANTNNRIYSVQLGSPSKYNSLYCNFTATFNGIEYFRRWGNYTINVTVTDTTSNVNNTIRRAYYAQTIGFMYPYVSTTGTAGSTILLGSINNFDQWSNALGVNRTKNTGNVRLNLTWNTTNFTCTTPVFTIPTNANPSGQNVFAVGNDSTRTNYAYMSTNQLLPVEFYPPSGMRRCGNYLCTIDEDSKACPGSCWSSYDLYWHINVSSGTPQCTAGDYTNSMRIDFNSYTTAG